MGWARPPASSAAFPFSIASSLLPTASGMSAGAIPFAWSSSVVTGGDIEATGSVHTTVQLGDTVTLPDLNGTPTTLAQFSAGLVAGAADTIAVVPLTDGNSDGLLAADFLFLNPGTYSLSLAPPIGITDVTTDPATPQSVNVLSGQELSAALTVTATN